MCVSLADSACRVYCVSACRPSLSRLELSESRVKTDKTISNAQSQGQGLTVRKKPQCTFLHVLSRLGLGSDVVFVHVNKEYCSLMPGRRAGRQALGTRDAGGPGVSVGFPTYVHTVRSWPSTRACEILPHASLNISLAQTRPQKAAASLYGAGGGKAQPAQWQSTCFHTVGAWPCAWQFEKCLFFSCGYMHFN